MKYIVIAPVGDNLGALFIGIRDFPTEKVVLLTPENKLKDAQKISEQLEQFKIGVQIIEIKGNIWEEMFRKIAEIRDRYTGKDLIVNTATGDRITTCAATSAAFVNGLKAIAIEGNESMLLPILKFSYYRLLSDKKLEILEVLAKDKTCCQSLDDLAKRAKMSLPLISYHVNGNLKSEGLVSLGLVETSEKNGKVAISLTMLGRLLIKGYVKPSNQTK
ncbi:MAG: hypothetical protein HY363_04565 [Candidatus Aenigmarchaeota archaeon]|nr:hypothetical protein [Candidatus Aenigmarchaeota archaeon]